MSRHGDVNFKNDWRAFDGAARPMGGFCGSCKESDACRESSAHGCFMVDLYQDFDLTPGSHSPLRHACTGGTFFPTSPTEKIPTLI